MKDQSQKKQEKETVGVNPVAAAIAGAVVGAGVAVVGAVALNDEKMRVKKVFTDVKTQATGYIDEKQRQAQESKDRMNGKVVEVKADVKEATNSVKDAVQDDVKSVKKVVNKRVKNGI